MLLRSHISLMGCAFLCPGASAPRDRNDDFCGHMPCNAAVESVVEAPYISPMQTTAPIAIINLLQTKASIANGAGLVLPPGCPHPWAWAKLPAAVTCCASCSTWTFHC